MAWLVARAFVQSITIDEADSYLGYAAPPWPSHWYPSSGNHVLNSILVRLFTSCLGPSHLTLRLPALIGAAIYLRSALRFCVLLRQEPVFRCALFACLTLNPFIMDYLVASRGYSLALAFLLTGSLILATEVLADHVSPREFLFRRAAMASACAALSFAANFSFAFVDAALVLAFLAWLCFQVNFRLGATLRALLACAAPAVLVTLVLCGSVLRSWPKGQLYYGATSVAETWNSIVSASFCELNPFIVNPVIENILERLKLALPGLLLGLAAVQLAFVAHRRPDDYPKARSRAVLSGIFAGVISASALSHWIAFHLFGLLLPKDRTAIFFAPLTLLLFGTVNSGPVLSSATRATRVLCLCVLFAGATYFVGCLRLAYFNEWKFDVDMKETYVALQGLSRNCGITEAQVDWPYSSSLLFYRDYFRTDALQIKRLPLTSNPRYLPLGKEVYVLSYPNFREFIQNQHLKIVFRGQRSDVVIGLSEAADRLNRSAIAGNALESKP